MPRGVSHNNIICELRVMGTLTTPPQLMLMPIPGFITHGCLATATPRKVSTSLRGTKVAQVAGPQFGLSIQMGREFPCCGELGTPYMATPIRGPVVTPIQLGEHPRTRYSTRRRGKNKEHGKRITPTISTTSRMRLSRFWEKKEVQLYSVTLNPRAKTASSHTSMAMINVVRATARITLT